MYGDEIIKLASIMRSYHKGEFHKPAEDGSGVDVFAKIQFIKEIRSVTGWGLKESKDFADKLDDTLIDCPQCHGSGRIRESYRYKPY